jgi:hypothetical protein
MPRDGPMNVPIPGSAGSEVVTQESLLLATVERVARYREGRVAVQIHLSGLRPQNRQEGHIRIALRTLEPMVNAYRGQMFLLANSDIVFLLKDANGTDVENVVFKLRALFSKDPLTFGDGGDGQDRFCTWFELETTDYNSLLELARAANAAARAKARDTAVSAPPRPIDAKALGEVLNRVSGIELTGFVRRQTAIEINQFKAQGCFQEFFVALGELQKALAPEINLLGNPWLFQHLSQTLDQKVLAALQTAQFSVRPTAFSLNLNIHSVLSPAFDAFDKAQGAEVGIIVEFQVLDVLADSKGFYAARQRLRNSGRRVAIDGLNELPLHFMDVAQFGADLHKLTWGPELVNAERSLPVSRAVNLLGAETFVLARCDSEAAISWGLDQGIQRFQGRYVDAMLAAYTMQFCGRSATCTVQQCVARRGVIAGPLRTECANLDMVDRIPDIRTPKLATRGKT